MMDIDFLDSLCLKQSTPDLEYNEINFCENCGGESFIETDFDYLEDTSIISEKLIRCDQCDFVVNEWCYGSYRNEKSKKYINLEKKQIRLKKIKTINDPINT